MQTQLTPITELQPGDKVFVAWAGGTYKPEKWPEVLTVKRVNLHNGTVDIRETGGLCLAAPELFKVIDLQPVAGDTITFDLETWDKLGLMTMKEFTALVESTSFDPIKKREPKCIVTVDGENYGIPFSEIKTIQKKQQPQLSLF